MGSRSHKGARSHRTVRKDAEILLKKSKRPYAEIVSKLRDMHPEANPTLNSVRWYASKMRQAGQKVPERRA